MDEAAFREFEQHRYSAELHECEKWGIRNDWTYKLLQMVVILFSVLVTTSIALEQFIPGFPGRLSALIASLLVTSAASALKIFNFQGKALYYAILRNES